MNSMYRLTCVVLMPVMDADNADTNKNALLLQTRERVNTIQCVFADKFW